MSRIKPSSRGLRHGAPDEEFAAAISYCEGYAPECSYSGKCQTDGDCFRQVSRTRTEAARLILGLCEDASPAVAEELKEAVRLIRRAWGRP